MRNYYFLQYQLLIFSIFLYNFVFTIQEYPYVIPIYSVEYGYNIDYYLHGLFFNTYRTIVNSPDLLKLIFLSKFLFIFGLLNKKTRKLSLFLLTIHNCFFEDISKLNSPETRFLNILYLSLIAIPENKFRLFNSYKKTFWMYPLYHQKVLWIIAAVAYSVSGFYKLISPAWQSGQAIKIALLNLHEARFDFTYLFSFSFFNAICMAITYILLCSELLAFPMVWNKYSRLLSFLLLTGMHISVLITMDIAQVSFGMLVYHLYLFEPKWFKNFKFLSSSRELKFK